MLRGWGRNKKRLINPLAPPLALHTLVFAVWLAAPGLASGSLQPRSVGRVFS
jgi:hypothetical protein